MTEEIRSVNFSGGVVGPHDCALAVAIPLSAEELAADFEDPRKEFARTVVAPAVRAASGLAAWNGGYAEIASHVAEIVDEVRGLGVTVVERATLADVARLAASRRVVTILAHGPFPLLNEDDVLDRDALWAAFRPDAGDPPASNPTIRRISRESDVRNAQSFAQLIDVLRELIRETRKRFFAEPAAEPGVDILAALEARGSNLGLTRMHLREGIPGAIKSPPIIELADGIKDFDQFCGTLPQSFTGVLEFLACAALWFGPAIRRRRSGCGDILSPNQRARIVPRARLYVNVCRLLAQVPMGYSDATLAVHRTAMDWYKQNQAQERAALASQKIAVPKSPDPNSPAPFTVYIAQTIDSLDDDSRGLADQLKSHGVHVVFDQRIPNNFGDLERQVSRDLNQAQISIHLLGNQYGKPLVDDPRSISHVQYDLAGKVARAAPGALRRLVWIPPQTQLKFAELPAEQQTFLASIMNETGDAAPKILGADFGDFKQALLAEVDPTRPRPDTNERGQLAEPFAEAVKDWSNAVAFEIALGGQSETNASNESPTGQTEAGFESLARDQAEVDPNQMECSVFAGPHVERGSSLFIQAFLHRPDQADHVAAMAAQFDTDARIRGSNPVNADVAIGTVVWLELTAPPGIVVGERVQQVVWRGRSTSVAFEAGVPRDYGEASFVATIQVSIDSVPCGKVRFKTVIGPDRAAGPLPVRGIRNWERYCSAFISHSSKDRDEVLKRVQMLKRLRIEVFQDVLSIEPGEEFAPLIYRRIDECDVFFLFWSTAAKASTWVHNELTHALARRKPENGDLPDLVPVILEGPPAPLPPPELAHLNFNDPILNFLSVKYLPKS
jgi:hypothetical protein